LKTKLIPAIAAALLLGAGVQGLADEDPRALMLQARALQRRGGGDDPEGAVTLYRRVVALVPSSSQAWLRLSESLMETGNLAAALESAQKAAELGPRSGEAWAHLGLLCYLHGQTTPASRPRAVEALRKAVKLVPGDPELWTRLGELQEFLEDERGALKAWLAVGRIHPTATYRGRPLGDLAWERAMELAVKLKEYDARREAVLALCDRPYPDQRYLKFLEDLARDQVDAGFLGHAEESFQLLAQFIPQEPAIWENIAVIQLRTGRFETALGSLAKAEAKRRSTRVSFNTALCLMKVGRFKEAEERWKALLPALGAGKEDKALLPSVRALYATCLLLTGRPGEVLELLASWPDAGEQGSLASLRAQALVQTGAWKAARAALREGAGRFPDQGIFQKARELPPELLEDSLLVHKEQRQACQQLDLEAMAALWADFNGWEQCLAKAREARGAAPIRDVDLLLLEANALETLGRSREAMAVLREGQKLNPGHPTLQNNLGFLLLEQSGDLEEASSLIQAALAKDPENSSTMDSWGWALFKRGRFQEAEAALRKAAKLNPFSPEIHRHLGEALLRLERAQEALDEWDRALAFSFPGRKELEAQAQDLRTRLAKKNAESDPQVAEEETGDASEPGEAPEDAGSEDSL
jgi:Flp pilus assembly protein TadD